MRRSTCFVDVQTPQKNAEIPMRTNFDRRAFLAGFFSLYVLKATTQKARAVDAPFDGSNSQKSRSIESTRGIFTFQTDFNLSEIESEIASLEALADELTQTLEIPAPREKVLARILPDETSWRAFFKKNFPGLAYRTAMFDRKNYLFDSRKSRLYAFRGPNLEVDLRHEGTHALLTASLRRSVPIWLDEGLAEYFEEAPEARRQNAKRSATTVARLENGAFSSLELLESVSDVSSATSAFYSDSWAWTNYLLNASSKTRAVVSEYLNDLARSRPFAPKISARLKKIGGGKEALHRFYRDAASRNRA